MLQVGNRTKNNDPLERMSSMCVYSSRQPNTRVCGQNITKYEKPQKRNHRKAT